MKYTHHTHVRWPHARRLRARSPGVHALRPNPGAIGLALLVAALLWTTALFMPISLVTPAAFAHDGAVEHDKTVGTEVPLNVAFVWHQHQPLYVDPATGEAFLPWVRMHAIKDYYDMAAILQQYPSLKATFNLVPSLIEQLVAYYDGEPRDLYEKWRSSRPLS